MPRKTIQKNLAYDTERQLYYAVFRQDGRRYTRTYRTREEAQAALEGNSCADRRLPGKDCTATWHAVMCCLPWEGSLWRS